MSVNPHRRLYAETVPLTLEVPIFNPDGTPRLDDDGKPTIARHSLTLSLAYDRSPDHPAGMGALRELAFVGRGRSGQGLDFLLTDLAIKVSRAIQGRDPATGVKIFTSEQSAAVAPDGAAP
jgi:hypothetical protein